MKHLTTADRGSMLLHGACSVLGTGRNGSFCGRHACRTKAVAGPDYVLWKTEGVDKIET
jgi:hypothetical protein